jgi:hypothetical protein
MRMRVHATRPPTRPTPTAMPPHHHAFAGAATSTRANRLRTTKSNTPSGSNANFCQLLAVPVQVPRKPIFASAISVSVFDNRLGGFVKAAVGTATIALDGKIPGATEVVTRMRRPLKRGANPYRSVEEGEEATLGGGDDDPAPAVTSVPSPLGAAPGAGVLRSPPPVMAVAGAGALPLPAPAPAPAVLLPRGSSLGGGGRVAIGALPAPAPEEDAEAGPFPLAVAETLELLRGRSSRRGIGTGASVSFTGSPVGSAGSPVAGGRDVGGGTGLSSPTASGAAATGLGADREEARRIHQRFGVDLARNLAKEDASEGVQVSVCVASVRKRGWDGMSCAPRSRCVCHRCSTVGPPARALASTHAHTRPPPRRRTR